MNRKPLIVLLVLVFVLGGAGIIVYKHNSSTWQAPPPSGKVLGDFSLNDVSRVSIQTGSASLLLTKKNDKWVVPASGNYPADFERVASLIQTLWQLKPVEDEQVGPSQLERFNLLPPGKGDGTGTLVELQGADSKPLASLLVGKKFLKKTPQAPDQEGYAAGRYVMPTGSNPPKVSLVSETLEQVDPTPTAWLDKSFLKIDNIKSVSISSGTNQWTVTRDSDTENTWKLAGAKPSEAVDQEKVPYFVSIFGSPTFNDVLPAGSVPAGYDSIVTVTTFDQFIYTLKFGKAAGDNLPLSIAVSANPPPRERTPGKDENPEDKKRLDEEFAAHTKQLADRLAKDDALSARTYLVPKTTFDALFVPRTSLLAPPPASTPAPAKAGPTPKKSAPPA